MDEQMKRLADFGADSLHLYGPRSWRLAFFMISVDSLSVRWTLSLAVTSELLLNHTKDILDPEEEQDRLTELLNSINCVFSEVSSTFNIGMREMTYKINLCVALVKIVFGSHLVQK